MSAICGVVGLDGRPWNEANVAGMLRELAPLGAHGRGVWAGKAGRSSVAVAAALRHATPEDRVDRQPARSADGSLVLVADLRLDNRDELASALGLRDDRSTPDTAFVLAAYTRWGDGFLDRIVGEFALALVDRRRGGVLLARDHVGARPLAVHERPGVVAFASTALALAALEGVGHALDLRRAAEVLAYAYLSERTFVAGVRSLPPAGALWTGGSGWRRWTWWSPDPHETIDLGTPAAHERELREAFDRAVAARLRSVGTVGAMVSGGLDSSSAAATAAHLLAPEPLPTYTSAPPPSWAGASRPGWDADDSPLVRKLAELHENILPSFVHVHRGESLFDLHEPLWEMGAAPGWNPCNWLWFHAISLRAQADGVTTLLSGGSGNCAFSADGPGWLVSLLRAGRLATAAREAASWGRVSGDGVYRTLRSGLVAPLVPAWARRVVRAIRGRPDPATAWLERTALRPELAHDLELPRLRPGLDDGRLDERRFLLWSAASAACFAETRAAMAAVSDAEERDPTVDRRVLHVAMRQPDWVRRHDGVGRAVVRGAMADRLPPEIVHRRRYGEQLPEWLDVMSAARSELAAELEELSEHDTSRQLIDVDRLRRLMERWPHAAARNDATVVRDYRRALFRSLLVSRYLRWFERRAASTARADGARSAAVDA